MSLLNFSRALHCFDKEWVWYIAFLSCNRKSYATLSQVQSCILRIQLRRSDQASMEK